MNAYTPPSRREARRGFLRAGYCTTRQRPRAKRRTVLNASKRRFPRTLPSPCADTRSAFGAPVSVFLRDGPGSIKRPLRHIPFTDHHRPRPKASVQAGISCGRNLRKHTGRSSSAPLPSSSRDSFGEPHENLHGKVPTSHSFGKRRRLPYGTILRSNNEFVARYFPFSFTTQPQAFQEVLLEEHPETPAAKSTVRAPCQTIPRVLCSNPGETLTSDAR